MAFRPAAGTALVLLVATASSAAASPQSPFCQDAAIFGKGQALQTLPPATLKADSARFKTLSTKMVPLAPTAIRADLRSVLTFDLGLFTELSKVGWSFARVPPSVFQKWAVAGPKLRPASDKVITYIDSACGLKLRKP